MDQTERRELKRLVAITQSTLRAGIYNDAAAQRLLSLYPSMLEFWNRRFARHAQVLKDMQRDHVQNLVRSRAASTQDNEAYRMLQAYHNSQIAVINTECEAGMNLD